MLEPGDLVEHYRVIRVIGRGGMSIVYLVRDEVLGVDRAMKELSEFHASDPAWREQFRAEAQLAASLGDHPSIVTIHDYFVWNDRPYIVMPYFGLGTVKSLVQTALSTEQVLGIVATVLEGVDAAEERGVAHRDLKPDNLVRTDHGTVKINDFGIATTLVLQDAHLTASGILKGTELYVAPELVLGARASTMSDLYSVGVIAYELFRGRPPFGRPGLEQGVLVRKVRENALPIRRVVPDLDIGIAAWIDRMLARDPRRRPAHADDALRALDRLADGALGSDWRRRSKLPRQTPPPKEDKVAPIASQLIGFRELRGIVILWWHALRVLFSPSTLAVTGIALVAAIAWGDGWRYALAAGGYVAMSVFRFFDLEVVYASRGFGGDRIKRLVRRLVEEPT